MNFNYLHFSNNVVYIDSKYFALYTNSVVSLSVCTNGVVSLTPTFQLHVFEQPLVPACSDKLLSTVCDK